MAYRDGVRGHGPARIAGGSSYGNWSYLGRSRAILSSNTSSVFSVLSEGCAGLPLVTAIRATLATPEGRGAAKGCGFGGKGIKGEPRKRRRAHASKMASRGRDRGRGRGWGRGPRDIRDRQDIRGTRARGAGMEAAKEKWG